MLENLELLRNFGAHRGVATKLYNEADGIMNKPFTLLNEDDLIQLQQIVELLKKKQTFLSEKNRKIQSFLMIPTTWTMKLLRQRNMMTRYAKTSTMFIGFVRQKTGHSSQESSFAAGSNTISRNIQNINLSKLDLPSFSGNYLDWISFFDRFKGAVIDND